MSPTPKTGVAIVLDCIEGALRRGEEAPDVVILLRGLAALVDLEPEKLWECRRRLDPEHKEMRQLISAVIAGFVTSEELRGVGRSLRVSPEDVDRVLSEVLSEVGLPFPDSEAGGGQLSMGMSARLEVVA